MLLYYLVYFHYNILHFNIQKFKLVTKFLYYLFLPDILSYIVSLDYQDLLLLHNNLFVLLHWLHSCSLLDKLPLLRLRLYNNFKLYKLHNYLYFHNLHYERL
ncbi:hypothetical protein FACS189475_04220 [Betaproteobacteria bacterium]|nr:hypothetical protein FACS189475_04220 [Betaproteobacteria bacterium]